MAERIPQSTSYELAFKAFLTATGAEATGLTIPITISKNGATSFSNPSGGATNATEIGNGWYFVVLTTTDTGTLGRLAVRGTVATTDDVGVALTVVSATTMGATNLDAAITTRMATYTQPTGFLSATFPAGTVANTTNITAGTIATVTTVTGLIASNLDTTVSSRLATSGYTAPPTAAQNATQLLDVAAGVETGLTVRQALRLVASALLGKASGLATTTGVFRDTGDTKDRITATIDASGNRTAVTLDAT